MMFVPVQCFFHPCLFHSDYNKNHFFAIFVAYLTPEVRTSGSVVPQYLSLKRKRVNMNVGGKGC